ncbi:MAG: hypothetical protein ACOVOR_00965 [Rhabdochlamydiaceae bacterium]
METGQSLLKENWNDFKSVFNNHPDLLEKLVSQSIEEEGEYKNLTAFHLLFGWETGQILLKERWDDFASIIKNNPKILFSECVDGESSIFCALCSTDIGFEILNTHKYFFHDLIKKHPIRLVNNNQENSPFHKLCEKAERKELANFFLRRS